jgi:hypothetical protein
MVGEAGDEHPDHAVVPGPGHRDRMGGRRPGLRGAGRGPRSGRGAARGAADPAARGAAVARHDQRAGPPFRRYAERGLPAPSGAAPRRPGQPAAQRASRALPSLRARLGAAGAGGGRKDHR